MKKQILAGVLSATMVVGMGGVSVFAADNADDKTYNIGICQLVQHEHLTQQHRDSRMPSQKNLATKLHLMSRTHRVIPIPVLLSSQTSFLTV